VVKKKVLDSKHTLFFTTYFPYNSKSKGGYSALLGIGGNVGDTMRRFEHLFWYFKRSKFIYIVESSPILKNPAFGYIEQDDFYNALLLIETPLEAKRLLDYLFRVERLFGRKRSFANAPRTLDIDIIFYENSMIDTKDLTLPHPGWMKRSSVLIPLSTMKNHI
jgi:2-amino-4-hydroxy-6-hydroxymethyldihydropteridine diphosphokinase